MQSHIFGSSSLTPFEMWSSLGESYRVISDIAVGRDGTSIKKAQELSTGNFVTLKVMPVRDEERRQSCRREAELLASANHRNVLAFYAAYESRTEFVLVTEYCPGGDLLDRVNTHGKIPESEARDYIVQIIGAVQYLHSRGISHRDVKLDNIFITNGNVLKLGDFGFACKFTEGERFNSACGTLVYVAPELLVINPNYDPIPAEIYSLGVTLFAMCAAYLPYDALDEMQVIADVRKGGVTMPAHFSAELSTLVRSMINVASSARPSLSAVRQAEWITQGDRFQRSYSQPGMRSVHIEQRPRAYSVNDYVSSSVHVASTTNNASSKVAVHELPATAVLARSPSTKTKRASWLYRKLVKPIASRISGGSKIDLSTAA